MPADTPTENPDRAGTAPIDLATLTPEASPPADNEVAATGQDKPVGGMATTAATSWTGASDEELDDAAPTE